MKIVFHGANAKTFSIGFERFVEPGHEIVTVSDALSGAGEVDAFRAAEVLVTVRLSAAHPRPEALRLLQAPAAGTDAIDRACLPAGAKLCNCFGHEAAITEYVIAALLSRHVPLSEADGQLRRGDWTYWAGKPTGLRTELGASTIGLLGFGHIGKAIAAAAKAFGMTVNVCNRTVPPIGATVDRVFSLDQLGEFMASADVVVTSLPLTDQTAGLVSRDAIARMREGALLVNVGRGPVIDELALFEALSAGRIEAIIDTWYRYPSADDPNPQPSRLPFNELSSVLMTPHMSGWTHGTIERRQKTIGENIRRLHAGEPLLNIVELN